MKIGTYFTLDELTFSQTAVRKRIDNTPGAHEIACLGDLAVHVLDPLRQALGKPIRVSSGYRSPALNVAIGGAPTSQHCLGQAADINVPGMTVAQLADAVQRFNLPFDQLIDEFGLWVHVSYSSRNRRQFLIARTVGDKTVYSHG